MSTEPEMILDVLCPRCSWPRFNLEGTRAYCTKCGFSFRVFQKKIKRKRYSVTLRLLKIQDRLYVQVNGEKPRPTTPYFWQLVV